MSCKLYKFCVHYIPIMIKLIYLHVEDVALASFKVKIWKLKFL